MKRKPQQLLELALRRAGERLKLQIRTSRALGRSGLPAELGRVIRTIHYAVLVADDDQRYVDANPAACRLLRYTRAELLQLRVGDVVALESPVRGSAKRWRSFLDSSIQESEIPLRRADQSIVVVSYWAFTNVTPGLHVSILSPSIASIDEAVSLARRMHVSHAADAPSRSKRKVR